MTIKRFFSLLAMMLCAVIMTTAQNSSSNVNFANINVNSLTENQLKDLATKAKANNFTLDQALDQAKARGASERQITQLRQRLKKYFPETTSKDKTTTTKKASATKKPVVVKKGSVIPTAEDSLVYGFDLFNKTGLTFEPSTSFAVSGSYRICIGDELALDIYGSADQTYELTVGKDGTVTIPMVGPLKIAGLTLDNARSAVINKMKSIYSDLGGRTKASLRLTDISPIKVSVMGECFLPGTYTVSGAATLMHALYLCGGPTYKGSLRDIQLYRDGKIIDRLDVYDFLINGTDLNAVGLTDGDIIMIPTYIKRVEAQGALKHTGIFEAKEGETVADLIRFAGGFTAYAMPSHMGLTRVGKYTTEFKEVTKPESIMLNDGDELFVGSIDTERMDGGVYIEGAVFAEGFYEYTEGVTLRQLIEKAGGLKENAFLNRGVITRLKDDYTLETVNFNVGSVASGNKDLEIKSGDQIKIMSIDDMQEPRILTIKGAVNSPGEFPYAENTTVADLIVLANGLLESASQYNIEIMRRIKPEDAEKDLSVAHVVNTIDITRDLSLDESKNSFVLEPYDQVYIHPRANAEIGGTVSLVGCFVSPGDFGLPNNAVRLSEIIQRCGGVTERAYVDGARIYRKIKMLDIERDLRMQRIEDLHLDTMAYLKNMIDEKDGVAYELVAINLCAAIDNPESTYDIFLCDKDILVIPEISQTVRVSGTVQSPTSTTWTKRWKAKKYVKTAGGFAARAHKKHTYVVYPSGQSKSVTHFLGIRRYPKVLAGSEVIVPEKPETTMTPSNFISIGASLVTLAVAIIAIL